MFGWRRERARRREDRRWQDAEVLADVRQLLHDVQPERRGINVNPAPGAEDDLWASLNQRRDDVERRLLVLAAGHPSTTVQSSAEKLAVEVLNAAVHSHWHVIDILKGSSNIMTQLSFAQECHATALATCAELERAIKAAAHGK
jgi:hypothetical protein